MKRSLFPLSLGLVLLVGLSLPLEQLRSQQVQIVEPIRTRKFLTRDEAVPRFIYLHQTWPGGPEVKVNAASIDVIKSLR